MKSHETTLLHAHLEEQPQLLPALMLQVVRLMQALIHVEHAKREGLAGDDGDVGGCHGAHHAPLLGICVVGAQIPAQNSRCFRNLLIFSWRH